MRIVILEVDHNFNGVVCYPSVIEFDNMPTEQKVIEAIEFSIQADAPDAVNVEVYGVTYEVL